LDCRACAASRHREQVKRQIRVQIETGELQAGDPLPSAKDPSAMLNINRNTITQFF
jgi:DNA-binding transcriptional regulator YhcF (GntR family)